YYCFGFTVALIRNLSVPFSVLVIKVIFLLTVPLPLPSNLTNNSPLSPGATGSLVYSGIVHPQLLLASVITNGASPVLVNENKCSTCVPCTISPKSNCSSLNDITG